MSTNTADQMSPKASPDRANTKVGVRRMNNMPLYIIGSMMGVFLVVMVVVAADRAAQQNRAVEVNAEKKPVNTVAMALAIAGDRTDGIIQPQSISRLVVPELSALPNTPDGTITSKNVDNIASEKDAPRKLEAPSTAPTQYNSQPQSIQRNEEKERIRELKMQQFEEAVKAKTGVTFATPHSTGDSIIGKNGTLPTRAEQLEQLAAVRRQIDANTRDDPAAAFKDRLQLLQTAALDVPTTTINNEDRWNLDSKPEAPKTPYTLRAGFVVPATLISGINSELPGQIIGQVSQDVYDTATGDYRLIPQGSRLVGSYSSDVVYGQARLLVVWQRIIFPDGKAMDIGNMPGSDSAGYSGFNDQVNNHLARLLGSAVLMSGVTAGIASSQRQNESSTPTTGSAMSEALGQQLGQVTAQLIAKNMNIAPTLEIRPGYRFNVMVIKDMLFTKPYESFDY